MSGLNPKYPLAKNPVFWSWQGEAHLRGFGMAFIRLAKCSVNCSGCDTDYRVASRMTVSEILQLVEDVTPIDNRDRWAWITGGEPTEHDLAPLMKALKGAGYSTALATSGVRRVIPPVDWLSVSPHSADPAKFQQRYGSEVKLVDGLNGLDIDEWYAAWPDSRTDFMYRYVQPKTVGGVEDPESLERCKTFLRKHSNWSLSRQDHVAWGAA